MLQCVSARLNRVPETAYFVLSRVVATLNHLYKTFAKNSYPKRFIDSVYKRKRPPKNTRQNIHKNSLPYIHKISEITSRILNKLHLKVAHKPANKLKSAFTKHKRLTDHLDQHHAVYMIPRQDCDNVYIGETLKTMKSRITEHKNAIKREDTRSIPATHVMNNDHRLDWNKTTILDHAETRQAKKHGTAYVIPPSIDISTSLQHTKNSRNYTNPPKDQEQPIRTT